MLSKEEKLRYGEILRDQIREREEAKKKQALQKRGLFPPNEINRGHQPHSQMPPTQTQLLQRSLQHQPYKPNGGQRQQMNQPTNVLASEQPSMHERHYLPTEHQQHPSSSFTHLSQEHIISTQPNRIHPRHLNDTNERHVQQIPHSQPSFDPFSAADPHPHLQSNALNSQYNLYPPQYHNQYPPQYNNTQQYLNHQPKPQFNPKYPYSQQNPPSQQNAYRVPQIQANPQSLQHLNAYDDRIYDAMHSSNNPNARSQSNNVYEDGLHSLQHIQPPFEDQPKHVRGILKSENETAEQRLLKQRQKMEMQKHLQLQIKMAEERKKEEKERLKREELQEERKGMEYIALQKQKILDEETKKQHEKQKIIEDNLKNLELRRKLQEEAKTKNQAEKNKKIAPAQPQPNKKQIEKEKIKKKYEDQSESISQTSESKSEKMQTMTQEEFESQATIDQPMRSKKSKNHKRKDTTVIPTNKLQKFTSQIRKMRDEIDCQGQLFQQEIDKIKWESQKAQFEKQRAEEQIKQLRHQILRKNKQDQQRLFQALNRQQAKKHESNFDDKPFSYPTQANQNSRERVKMQKKLQTTNLQESNNKSKPHQFSREQHPQRDQDPSQFVSSLKPQHNFKKKQKIHNTPITTDGQFGTLNAQSLKIPLNGGNDFSISKLGSMARNNKKETFTSMPVEDELDKLVVNEKRQNSSNNPYKSIMHGHNIKSSQSIGGAVQSKGAYGATSTVKEIEDLLRQKANQNARCYPTSLEGRPQYQNDWSLSKAGEEIKGSNGMRSEVSSGQRQRVPHSQQYGIPYENNGLLTVNSNLDLDEIGKRNDRRLAQLRQLGVETINTAQDENQLQNILQRYK